MKLLDVVDNYLGQEFTETFPRSVMVAVSGGADSMALLHVFSELKSRLKFKIYVLHLNHQLQDKAPAAEQLVESFCCRNGIDFVGGAVLDPARFSETRRGLEAEARAARYDWFERVAGSLGCEHLFLAHHRDDQVETVLLNIGRGCGLDGLEGMREVTRFGENLFLHRPLLAIQRAEIMKYIQDNEIPFVRDPSNENLDYARNRIRHRLLPQWEKAQPDPQRAVYGLSQRARRENDFWRDYLAANFDYREKKEEVRIRTGVYLKQHRAARLRFLHFTVRRLAGSIRGFGETNFFQIDSLFTAQSGKRLDLPGNLKAIKEYEWLAIYKKLPELKPEKIKRVPVELSWGGGSVKIMRTYPENAGIHYVSFLNYLPASDFIIRSWQPGDCLRGAKEDKLKELFEQHRVPYRARRRWPLLVEDGGVFAVPGFFPSGGKTAKIVVSFQTEEACFY
ncbi:MAG: tRNA lysidine(34) synthetase TilS, partial [bacterium]